MSVKIEDLVKIPLKYRSKMFFKKCKTKEELSKFIQVFFGLHLPDCTVSRFADTNPLQIIWEVYNLTVNKHNPEKIEELLYVAGRGSGKTLGMAIAELLIMLHDGRDVCHVGAVIAQAKRCYEYQTNFMLSPRIRPILDNKKVAQEDRVLQKLNMEKSAFNIDGKSVTIEVLPCTLKACPTGDSIVKTERGYKRVDELCIDDKLESVHFNDMSSRFTNILKIKPKYADCVSIELEDNRVISGDAEHKVLTSNGWIKLKDLKAGIQLLSKDNLSSKTAPSYRQPKIKYENWENILVGMMLGDASLSFSSAGTPRIYKAHTEKQWDYLYSCSSIISKYVVIKNIRDRKSGFGSNMKELISESTTKLNFLKDVFYFGKKEVKDISKHMSPELLAYWFMDDGIKGDQAGFAVCDFNEDSVNHLIDQLRAYGFRSAKLRKANYPIIVLNSDDTRKLYSIIGKYVHPCMQYKLSDAQAGTVYSLIDGRESNFSKNGLPKEDDTRVWREWRKDFKSLPFIKVINKTFVGKHKVFQIEVDGSNFTEHSYFTNGVLSANCNGPHVPLVVTDEIDTVSGEGLKAFKEISGMLDSRGDKIALRVGISTRKSRYGLMNKMMEDAEEAGRHVRRWTAFEFTDKCPDERSGTIPTKSYHILDNMEVVDEKTYKLKDPKKQKEYVEQIMPGEKCLKCPAAAICLGDAKNQKSKSWMLKPVGELIKKVRSEGTDWALSQLMNLKPSVEGIIYKEFDEKIHVKDWNGMWKTLTGVEYPGECSHDIFVKKCHAMKLQCYAGVDWGWSNPNTVVYFFVDKRDNVFIVRADGMTYVSQPEWIHYIKSRYHNIYRCQLYFPDIADQGAVTEMRKAGLPVSSDNDKAINTGVQVIKKLLRVPGSQDTKIHLAKETTGPLKDEFLMYHFKTSADGTITEVPESEYDHWLDALRYPLTMLMGKGTMVLGKTTDIDRDKTLDRDGNYFRTPSPEEFASVNNIPINIEEPDLSKLGKIGKMSDLDDDDDDWNGGGGFLWSL